MTDKEVKAWLDVIIQDYIYEDVEDELMDMKNIIYNALDTQALKQQPCEKQIVKDWLSTFNTDSATECYTAVQRLKAEVEE